MPGRSPTRVRLACVKHAASVRSEPGSNSHVHPVGGTLPTHRPKPTSPAKAPPHLRAAIHSKDLNHTPRKTHGFLLQREQTAITLAAARASLPQTTMSISKATRRVFANRTRHRGGALLNAAPGQ